MPASKSHRLVVCKRSGQACSCRNPGLDGCCQTGDGRNGLGVLAVTASEPAIGQVTELWNLRCSWRGSRHDPGGEVPGWMELAPLAAWKLLPAVAVLGTLQHYSMRCQARAGATVVTNPFVPSSSVTFVWPSNHAPPRLQPEFIHYLCKLNVVPEIDTFLNVRRPRLSQIPCPGGTAHHQAAPANKVLTPPWATSSSPPSSLATIPT